MTDQPTNSIRIKIPPVYRKMAEPHRYKSFWGGRGSGKSWTYARLLVGLAKNKKLRILCTREFQASIRESVHQLLSNQISVLGLSAFYTITRESIKSTIGSEFIFKGLRANTDEIKSLEGVDICWIEEAQSISNESWQILIPTIRKEGSEIWLSWNTGEVSDPTYQRFVVNPPDDCVSVKVSYLDNPYFPSTLEKERAYLQRVDSDAYDHVWDGNPLSISNACIFKGKFVEEEFETPEHPPRFFFGSDWGFSNDPTTLIRSWITGNDLWIDYEAYGVGVELTEIAELFSSVPEYEKWIIYADNARPETISYLKKNYKLRVEPCIKGKGSVEDGIAFLRKFEKIHVHPRCKHTLEEFKLYSYKQDSKTQEVLPIVLDKNNHLMDALRYSLCKKIGAGGIDWAAVVG